MFYVNGFLDLYIQIKSINNLWMDYYIFINRKLEIF